MEKIKFLLDELEWNHPEWKKYFNDMRLHNDTYSDRTKGLINELIKLIRINWQEYIDIGDINDEENWKKKIEKMLGKETADDIFNALEEKVDIYRNTKILRFMEIDIATLITDIFYNLSVCYNPAFFRSKDRYKIEKEDDFVNCIVAIDHITELNIKRNFSKEYARKEFEKETGICEPYSIVYAQLYEKEYDRLQRNFCINRIEMLNRKLNYILEKFQEDKEA